MNNIKEVNDKLVWYYCNHKAFENIISNHELWLTDITQSNDYNEIYKTLSIFENTLCECMSCHFKEMEKCVIESLDKII